MSISTMLHSIFSALFYRIVDVGVYSMVTVDFGVDYALK
jgi:hypothetical protein